MSCSITLLDCKTTQLHACRRHRPASALFRCALLRRRLASPAARASDSGGNGVPSLDDTEAAPIPLVPKPAVPEAKPGPLLAVGAVALGAAVFVATRLGGGAVSFDTLASDAVPLSTALANSRPSVIEFYASWCEVCRELLPDTVEVERSYKDRVNFVALNVDNSKWAPEVAEYGVNGIPQYVFLDGSGNVKASAAGKVPRQVLEQNVAALAEGKPLPWARVREATTALREGGAAQITPRAHG